MSKNEIQHRLDRGSLIVEFPGVYRVGHRAPSVEARYMAAVKACGTGAVLCGRAAGWLWGLVRGPAPPPEVLARTERRVKGVRTRRRRRGDPKKDRTEWKGIPVTTVPATLVALSSVLSFDELGRAVHEADVRGTRANQIEQALERHPQAKNRARLLALAMGDAPIVLSRLERHFLTLLRRHRLPLPETNRPEGAGYVDCRWPARRLTVELDSYRFHRSRRSWEKDRQRERDARARGDEFRRYTWQDVVEDPAPTVAGLRRLLA